MKKETGYLLKMINDNFRSKVDAKLRSFDLTGSQGRVIRFIINSGGVTTQKAIEDFLEVSHPTVVGILSRMQKSGYIECGYDEEHGRNKIVRQTEKAVEFTFVMDKFFEETNEELTKGLSENEKNELNRMLEILYRNVKK